MVHLQTGDLLLFHGERSIISKIIEFCTGSKYSHCALVVRDPWFTIPPKKGLYLLESTSDKHLADIEDGRHKFGVQMHELTSYLESYTGTVYVRKLHCMRDQIFYNRFSSFQIDVHNLPYDLHIKDWLAAATHLNLNIQRKDCFWCSALVIYAYIRMGFVDSDTPWTLFSPQELSSSSKIKLIMNDAYLDPDLYLNRKSLLL